MASNLMTRKPRAPRANKARLQAEEEPQVPAAPKGSGFSIFKLLEKYTNVDFLFEEGVPLRYLPNVLFLTGITLFYIGNTHYAEKIIRRIDKIKVETEDLRADYTTLKSDYMDASKQSVVAGNVAPLGLLESSSPPYQVEVAADEY
ncbi:FtsL-like putative cell division protein [Pontibacter sp. 13R65]|uniref:FtsL-like putative cell division protein n=1 Tax=Pontibacter sp. 13R65 TaxID=3127458 RepID=UPI00301C571B